MPGYEFNATNLSLLLNPRYVVTILQFGKIAHILIGQT